MEIKYLTQLNNNPSINDHGYVKTLKPISLGEIVSLESVYNNGTQFPAALRELLFLAGGYCYVLDYGLNDTQAEMQEEARADLIDYGRNFSIARPFFVIDVYNSGTQFLFVYLDEGTNDPIVYEAVLDMNNPSWIRSMESTLSSVINSGIVKLLSGYNPF